MNTIVIAEHINKIIPDYETIRQHIVILSHMTGYENDDIYEYLENSFEAPIWDWGYFALIVGKLMDSKKLMTNKSNS